jgi:hypothetical protein
MANRSNIPVVTYIARASAHGPADRESRNPWCNHSRQTNPILLDSGQKTGSDERSKANQTQFRQAGPEPLAGSGRRPAIPVTFPWVARAVILAGYLIPWRRMVRSADD